MDCSKVQSMIEPFLNDELGDAEKENFISHVRGCSECHSELEVYHVIYSVVDQLDHNAEDKNIDYMATLDRKLTRSQSGLKRRRLYRQIAMTVAYIAVVTAVCFMILS